MLLGSRSGSVGGSEGVAMKQAGRWLLFAAALMVLPSTALAQKGGKPTGGGAAAGGGGAAAGGGAPAGGGAVDLDSDTPPTNTNTPPTGTGTGTPGSPEDCPPELKGVTCGFEGPTTNMAAEAKKKVKAEIYAVEQNPVLKYHRFEFRPYFGVTLNDQFVSHNGPGLDLNFYITNVFAIGLNGNIYSGLNVDSDFNFRNRRATRVAVPLTEYSWSAALNFTYVPVYGKFAGFGSFIFSYDIYATAGVGALSDRPIPVIDPDNRRFDYRINVAFNVGLGLRIFFTKWLAFNLELRDYIFPEKLENLTIAKNASDQSTWYADSVTITNNFQANIGLSVFLPFSFDYRLQK